MQWTAPTALSGVLIMVSTATPDGLADDCLRKSRQIFCFSTRRKDEKSRRTNSGKVFPGVAERALHFALGFCPEGRTSLWQKSIMRRQVKQLAIIGDALIVDFAQHRRLHAIVEDLRWYPAERFKGAI